MQISKRKNKKQKIKRVPHLRYSNFYIFRNIPIAIIITDISILIGIANPNITYFNTTPMIHPHRHNRSTLVIPNFSFDILVI